MPQTLALDPRRPDNVEAFLVGAALAQRPALTPAPGAAPRPRQLAIALLNGNRAPYHRHLLTLRRAPSGTLLLEIESFLSDPSGPARAEFGPLRKLAPSLRKLGGPDPLLGGVSSDLYCEAMGQYLNGVLDMAEPFMGNVSAKAMVGIDPQGSQE